MKRNIVGASATLLMAAGLITSAPPANAGCWYGGPVISKCDGAVQPDGTWQRCVAVARLIPSGFSSYLVPEKRCDLMGPDLHPADLAFADPPTHIDD
ncbi:CDGP domain-containing protein [Mycolicibacterium stellerae]|uniref:CDGP domain-containing protein n=1 Tax=Mycolicibacterium stellerae TaxID=2358193 RepID=UPI000F0B6F8C|nr:hypothetical protein [Mycolicibacterium stellerae]